MRVVRGNSFSSFVLRHFDLEFWDAPFFYPC